MDIIRYTNPAVDKIRPDCLCNLLDVDKNLTPKIKNNNDVMNKIDII